mmetsp:Transcript_12150/g.23355  ORF Transcript_12150/g.23355 Transcript_12150/m.23355 type:complete len:122 (+) Transcript_12150:1080-1445(+)
MFPPLWSTKLPCFNGACLNCTGEVVHADDRSSRLTTGVPSAAGSTTSAASFVMLEWVVEAATLVTVTDVHEGTGLGHCGVCQRLPRISPPRQVATQSECSHVGKLALLLMYSLSEAMSRLS